MKKIDVISDEMVFQAKEIVLLHEKQEKKNMINMFIPQIQNNMVLEYRDITGRWYEYTKELQDNIHFYPLKLRVRNK